MTLACSFLHRFYLHCVAALRKDVEGAPEADREGYPPVPSIESDEEMIGSGSGGAINNGFVSAPKPSIEGVQKYPAPKVVAGYERMHLGYEAEDCDVPLAARAAAEAHEAAAASEAKEDSVGRPVTHASGPLHCTGEALYADDIPAPANMLHGALILASRCHAKLVSVDTSPACRVPGVAGAFVHEDIVKLGGDNAMGPIFLDDVAFLPVGEKVDFVGQVLGIVVGASPEIAERGARAVSVAYEDLEGKALVSMEEAIEAGSFYTDWIHEMKRGGDVKDILSGQSKKEILVNGEKKQLVIVEGSVCCGGQEHFYLEPNSTLAIPSESATNLTIYASTQAPTKTQDFCARVTNSS